MNSAYRDLGTLSTFFFLFITIIIVIETGLSLSSLDGTVDSEQRDSYGHNLLLTCSPRNSAVRHWKFLFLFAVPKTIFVQEITVYFDKFSIFFVIDRVLQLQYQAGTNGTANTNSYLASRSVIATCSVQAWAFELAPWDYGTWWCNFADLCRRRQTPFIYFGPCPRGLGIRLASESNDQ